MLVLLTGGIDISVGAGIGFSAVFVGLIAAHNNNIPTLVVIIVGMIFGAVLGSFNGLLIVKFKMPPIIVTLGTLSIFRGLTYVINYYFNSGKYIAAAQLSESIKAFVQGNIFKIPYLTVITMVVYVFFYYFLRNTTTGREFYAVGSNVEGARIIGINVAKITFMAYLLCGALAGLGGAFWVLRYQTIQISAASGYEFLTITAVVLGGVSIKGGSGSIFGVLIGSVMIIVIQNALTLMGISTFWETAINGFIILFAVIIYQVISDRVFNRLLEKRKL